MEVKSGIKISTIGYVILYVKDPEAALSFYRDKLGMKVKMQEDGWIELETGATTLALHKTDKPVEKIHSQAIVVFNVEDIASAYNELKTRGIRFEKEPAVVCETPDHIGKSADFTDPDGNPLSIFGMVKR
jgi:lactoylglutathione lyase